MDKYQKYLITNHVHIAYDFKGKRKPCFIEDKIKIAQEEDITITKYLLKIISRAIKEVYIIKKGKSEKIEATEEYVSSQQKFSIEIDFENRIEAIKMTFEDGLVEEMTIPVEYEEADKKRYYEQKEQENKENLLKTADIKVSTGVDLVNIYFQPCCEEYEYTEIQLFIPKEFVTVGGPYGPVKKPSTWSMIKKCKVDTEDFYKSINGLAGGTYSFILKQFNKNGDVVLQTEHIEFLIKEPQGQGVLPRINRI